LSFVGVDGCRAGWFSINLVRSGGWEAGVGLDFHQVWNRWQQADTILVDIPIGLRESGQQERLCDRDARRILWALNGGESMQHNKKTEDGFKERLRLLNRYYSGSKAVAESVLSSFARKEVGKDDILDALAAAVTAKLANGSLRSLPEVPERDLTGLPMEMVYYRG
jgi:predicted RNase H-like nuclease